MDRYDRKKIMIAISSFGSTAIGFTASSLIASRFAITGSPRTANVVAEEPTTVLHVPAKVLRVMLANPHLNRLFLSKMTELMVR